MQDVDLNFSLAGKVALITGGSTGIGAAIADAFAQKGANIAIVGRNEKAATDKAAALADAGGKARAFACDVARNDEVAAMVAAVHAAFGRIDILVNNAGVATLAPAEDLDLDDWQKTLDVNLTGSFLIAQAVGRLMIKAGGGKIINISSQAGSVAIAEHIAYCASKFALIGVTKTLALEWGRHGITVNSISPTVVLTDLGRKAWAGEKGEAMKALIPTGRFAEPQEVAAAAVFLASNGADMINGADLVVDGGYTVK
ncbi:3-oxoacyl-[acyl-carrier protein] reductase [hydrothermal vent metagenome]|uniref:3-oxoacyl-[acyl-carrier protein] reductase n=1 Tax=hydrothermal vent metagenome TaxID=652676 RepID=A0A3B0TEA9_9ZZZZ